MKIAILGGDGFIGSHLVEKLYSLNSYDITVLSRTKNKYTNRYEKINYIYGDFNDLDTLRKTIWGTDMIIHLITTTVPSTSNLDPIYDINSNLLGTIRLLEEINKQNIKKLIFLSSGGTVYGNPKYIPIDEIHPLNPINSYGIVKMSIERYIEFYAKKYNIKYSIIRPSNPYGPRQNFKGMQGVISTFLYKSIKNEPLTIWGTGNEIRDYIYIEDLTDILQKIIENELQNSIYNVGYGTGHSVNEIVKIIEKVTNKNIDVIYKKVDSPLVEEVILDIRKVKNKFKWSPKIPLAEGIKKHLEWMMSIKERNE